MSRINTAFSRPTEPDFGTNSNAAQETALVKAIYSYLYFYIIYLHKYISFLPILTGCDYLGTRWRKTVLLPITHRNYLWLCVLPILYYHFYLRSEITMPFARFEEIWEHALKPYIAMPERWHNNRAMRIWSEILWTRMESLNDIRPCP